MSKKNSRAGGKYGGGHTTVIPAAGIVADIADLCGAVTKISVGFITSGLRPTKGVRRVKITSDGRSLLISVRDNISQQELRVYTTDVALAMHHIAKEVRAVGFNVTKAVGK